MPPTPPPPPRLHHPSPSAPPLFSAFARGKLILSFLFSQLAPLHWSARHGRLDSCRLLLQCNADVDAKDNW